MYIHKMRIIKKQGNVAFKTIVGEMINIESSTRHYIDGEPVEPTQENMSIYRGYPRVVDQSHTDILRAAYGYIFIPPDVIGEDFAKMLVKYLQDMQNFDALDGSPAYRAYVAISRGVCSVRRVKSRGRRMTGGNVSLVKTYNYFQWNIVPCDSICCEITFANLEDCISRHISSIFWDRDDICKLDHNEVTFTYSEKCLKGYDNILQDVRVDIFNSGCPLMVELSNYWKPRYRLIKHTLYTIPENKLISGTYDEVKDATTLVNKRHVRGLCAVCKSVLFDYNYALKIASADGYVYKTMCPLCLHSGIEDCVESHCEKILKYRSPITHENIIDGLEISDDLRKILLMIHEGIENVTIEVGSKKIMTRLIGQDYIGVDNIDEYMYTSMVNHPVVQGKKIFRV